MIQVRFKYDTGLERCDDLQMSCDVYKKLPDPVTNADILTCYTDIDITDINSASQSHQSDSADLYALESPPLKHGLPGAILHTTSTRWRPHTIRLLVFSWCT